VCVSGSKDNIITAVGVVSGSSNNVFEAEEIGIILCKQ